MSLHADPRSSSTYSITTDSVSAGGVRSGSAHYTNDGSVGETAGVSNASASGAISKQGYIGQLVEVTAVNLAAGVSSVNEGATTRLTATATFDDATVTSLAGSQVTWSVVSGPISSINANGLAAAGNVYIDSAASAQGSFRSKTGMVGLTVLNVGDDDLGLYAADGIDDAWQVQYFGLNNPNAGPLLDADGDGQNNLFEFTAGLIPNNAASHFSLLIGPGPDASNQKSLIFSPLMTGRTYTLECRTSLLSGNWMPVSGTVSDNGVERTVTDSGATETARFYRVQITKP